MNVLVVGGAGCAGSHACLALADPRVPDATFARDGIVGARHAVLTDAWKWPCALRRRGRGK